MPSSRFNYGLSRLRRGLSDLRMTEKAENHFRSVDSTTSDNTSDQKGQRLLPVFCFPDQPRVGIAALRPLTQTPDRDCSLTIKPSSRLVTPEGPSLTRCTSECTDIVPTQTGQSAVTLNKLCTDQRTWDSRDTSPSHVPPLTGDCNNGLSPQLSPTVGAKVTLPDPYLTPVTSQLSPKPGNPDYEDNPLSPALDKLIPDIVKSNTPPSTPSYTTDVDLLNKATTDTDYMDTRSQTGNDVTVARDVTGHHRPKLQKQVSFTEDTKGGEHGAVKRSNSGTVRMFRFHSSGYETGGSSVSSNRTSKDSQCTDVFWSSTENDIQGTEDIEPQANGDTHGDKRGNLECDTHGDKGGNLECDTHGDGLVENSWPRVDSGATIRENSNQSCPVVVMLDCVSVERHLSSGEFTADVTGVTESQGPISPVSDQPHQVTMETITTGQPLLPDFEDLNLSLGELDEISETSVEFITKLPSFLNMYDSEDHQMYEYASVDLQLEGGESRRSAGEDYMEEWSQHHSSAPDLGWETPQPPTHYPSPVHHEVRREMRRIHSEVWRPYISQLVREERYEEVEDVVEHWDWSPPSSEEDIAYNTGKLIQVIVVIGGL